MALLVPRHRPETQSAVRCHASGAAAIVSATPYVVRNPAGDEIFAGLWDWRCHGGGSHFTTPHTTDDGLATSARGASGAAGRTVAAVDGFPSSAPGHDVGGAVA